MRIGIDIGGTKTGVGVRGAAWLGEAR